MQLFWILSIFWTLSHSRAIETDLQNSKLFFTKKHPKRVAKFEGEIADKSGDLQGEGVKFIIYPSLIISGLY